MSTPRKTRRAEPWTPAEVKRLATAVRSVLELAIQCEGSTLGDGTYRNALNQSGRYSHTAEYLERVLAGAGLELRTRADAMLRQDGDRPVVGHVVLARKPATGIVD